MKVKIITGNKPAPGSTLLNKLFKIDGFIIKDIHPNKEQLVKIIVTITNSDFSLDLIPIKNTGMVIPIPVLKLFLSLRN